MKTIQCLAVASVISLFAVSAYADDWYAVGAIGAAKIKDSDRRDNNQALVDAGATGLVSTVDETHSAYKVQLGYRLMPNWALEGGYVDLGKSIYKATFTGGNARAETTASGLTLALVGTHPFNDQFSVFGKLGAIDAKVYQKATGIGLPGLDGKASSSDTKSDFGVGASYNFTNSFGVRIEWERFGDLGDPATGETNVDLMSVGLVANF
jgi:OOP family OmpA-OmpF porin